MGLSWSIQVEAKCHYRKSSILVTVSNIKKSLRENGCVLLMVLGAVHHGGGRHRGWNGSWLQR